MSEPIRAQEALAIVLPSLDPDKKIRAVLQGLVEKGFQRIVMVDDGSDSAHQLYFTEAEQYEAVTVLHHGYNRGKGCALKTAFRYVLDNMPDVRGVITIDGDGQHLVDDIIGELLIAEVSCVAGQVGRIIADPFEIRDRLIGRRQIPAVFLVHLLFLTEFDDQLHELLI